MAKSRYVYDNFITDESELTVSSEDGHVISAALKEGTGSAVITTSGTYTGDNNRKYSIEIDNIGAGQEVGSATFKWRRDDGSWTTGVTTSSSPITLEDGIQIEWAGGSGDDFELGDAWYFTAKVIFGKANLIDHNRDTRYKSASLGSPNSIEANFSESKPVQAICIYDHNLTEDAIIEALFDGGETNFVTNGFIEGSTVSPFTNECWDGTNGSISLGAGLGSSGDAMKVEVDAGSSDLVTNGDFTTNTTGWTGINAGLSVATGGQSGNCLKITRTSGSEQTAKTTSAISVTPYTKYRLKFYVKIDSGQEDNFKIILGNSNASVIYAELEGNADSFWTLYTLDFEGVNTSTVYIHLIRNSASAGYMLFDTVQLYLTSDIWSSAIQTITSLTIGNYYSLSFVVKDGDSKLDDWIARIGNYSLFGITSGAYIKYEIIFKANTTSMILHLSKFSGIQGYILFDEIQIFATTEQTLYSDWDRSPSKVLANSQFLDCNINHRVTGWEPVENENEGVIATYNIADGDSGKLFMKQGSSSASDLELRSSFVVTPDPDQSYLLKVIISSTTAALCSIKIGTTQGASDILNITTLPAGTYWWGFETDDVDIELLYISLIDGNGTSGSSVWDSVEIIQSYWKWQNPSFNFSPFDSAWDQRIGGGGGSITQDAGQDDRCKFTQVTSANMNLRQTPIAAPGEQLEITVNLNNASDSYTDCYLYISEHANKTTPIEDEYMILKYQFTGAGKITKRFRVPSTANAITVYIWDTQANGATSLWEYVQLKRTLLASDVKQVLDSNLILNGDFSTGWNADIINDDMQDDDTGDWTKVKCTLAFDTDHYVFTPTATGRAYFYQSLAVTEGEKYILRISHRKNSGTINYKLNLRIKIGSELPTYHNFATISGTSWKSEIITFIADSTGTAEISISYLYLTGFPVFDLKLFVFREYDLTEINNWERNSVPSGDWFNSSSCFAKPNGGVGDGISAYHFNSQSDGSPYYEATIKQVISVDVDSNYLLKIQKDFIPEKLRNADVRIGIEFNNGVTPIESVVWHDTDSPDTYDFLFSTLETTQIIIYVKIATTLASVDNGYELKEVFLYKVEATTAETISDFQIIHEEENTPRIFLNGSNRYQIIHNGVNTAGKISYEANELTIGIAYEMELDIQSTNVNNIKILVGTTIGGNEVSSTAQIDLAGTFKFYFVATAATHYITISCIGSTGLETEINSIVGQESPAYGYEGISNNPSGQVEVVDDGLYSNCFHLENFAGATGKIEIKKTWDSDFTLGSIYRLAVIIKSGDIDDNFLLELKKDDTLIENISGITAGEWITYSFDFTPSENTSHSITFRKNSITEGYIKVDQITITEIFYIRETIPWQENKIMYFLSGTFNTRNVILLINDPSNPDGYIKISELAISSSFEPSRALQHKLRNEDEVLSTVVKNTSMVESRKYRNISSEWTNIRYKGLTGADRDGFKSMLQTISDKITGTILPVFFIPEIDKPDEFTLVNIIDIKYEIMLTPSRLYQVTVVCVEELTSV